MSKRKSPKSHFIPSGPKKKFSIDDYLNKFFEDSDAKQEQLAKFFDTYLGYLEAERERLIEPIFESLTDFANGTLADELVRIVDLKYASDPLSTVGSSINAGGRFNMGKGLIRFHSFNCLYLAENDDTAYAEKFHYLRNNPGKLAPEEFSLKKVRDYACFGVNVSIDKVLDISDKENLRKFSEVISEIKPTSELIKWGASLGIFPLRTVQTHGELLGTMLYPEFLKNYYVLDRPSNSQWLGYYCLRAGIQAIKYPSVRNGLGHNYAVLIDNFKDTDCFVSLTANADFVKNGRNKIDGKNFEFFKFNLPESMSIN